MQTLKRTKVWVDKYTTRLQSQSLKYQISFLLINLHPHKHPPVKQKPDLF